MTFTNTVTPTSHDDRRASRLDARYALWDMSSNRRARACGRFVTDAEMGASVKVSGSVATGDRRAGFGGVQSCGSVWSCPVCSAKIQAERQAEVAAALAVARHRGWEVLFLTLTMRHNRDHRLPRLVKHLSKAWRATTSGSARAWKRDREDYGIAGYLRLVEVTHGFTNGWHVHVHCLLFIDPAAAAQPSLDDPTHRFVSTDDENASRPNGGVRGDALTDEAVQELGLRLFTRWKSALNVDGIKPSLRRGVDIRRVRSDEMIAEYFAKNVYTRKGEGSTSYDVTGSHGKDAKNGNRTPFGILSGLVDVRSGEISDTYERDLDLWHTYEKAMKGKRQMLWSNGLRADLLGDVEEKSDEEIVDEDHGGEVLDWLTNAEWKAVATRMLIAELLHAAESDDTGEALCKFITERLRLPDI